MQFQDTAHMAMSANESSPSSQVSTSLALLDPTPRGIYEQFEFLSTAVDTPPEGSGASASATIAVSVDGGHSRNQRALGASVSAARNQAAAGLSCGQPTTLGPATAGMSDVDGDENAAPQQHARYVCECTLLPTIKEGKRTMKLAFGCTHPNCNEIIIGKSNAKVHRHNHDFPRTKFPCDGGCGSSCGKSFAHKRDLDRHKKNAGVSAEKYLCACGRTYTRDYDRKRHCKTVAAARSLLRR
ncbi:hypothetical protein HK405_010289 [Cladochytrium tenue]|nr:hypothetical protein HK405_010289 [Cladochytrium tenue]